MKKILYFLSLSVFFFTACEKVEKPLKEIHDEYDETKGEYVSSVTYTLTDDDYATIAKAAGEDFDWVEDDMYLNETASPVDYIPAIVESNFPGLGKNSSVQVTYNYSDEMPSDLSAYTTTAYYELEDADYASFDGNLDVAKYFSPSYNPEVFIPSALEANVTAEEGDLVLVEYLYSDVDPLIDLSQVGYIPVYEEEFADQAAGLNDFTAISKTGDEAWVWKDYGGGCAYLRGYNTENEDWLISPNYDLSDLTEIRLEFTYALNYHNDLSSMKVYISSDYDGTNVETANWSEIHVVSEGGSWSFHDVMVQLDDYAGETVNVAFVYRSITDEANGGGTWEIGEVKITSPGTPITGKEPMTYKAFYEKSSEGWMKADGVYHVNAVDYDAMGSATGKYDNFSNSADPRDYLPQMLKAKFPLAGEGAEMVVVYKYYTGTTKTLASKYTLEGGIWAPDYNFIQERVSQFVNYGSEGWKFDPTVRFAMSSSDYQLIVDVVLANPDIKDFAPYDNTEYYYGASAYYSNFDIRLSKRSGQSEYDNLSDSEKVALMDQRVGEGIIELLKVKYPNAVTQIGGVDVFYIVSYATYDGSTNGTGTKKFQCTKAGPNPEFTFVE